MKVLRLIRLMLFLIALYWISMCGLFVSHAYTKGWIFADFESIQAKKAVKLINTKERLLLLDVRTKAEYKQKHLKNAINIPLQQLKMHLDTLEPHKGKPILVYCRSGHRSVKASRILEAHAFTPINIKGGIQQLEREHAVMAQ